MSCFVQSLAERSPSTQLMYCCYMPDVISTWLFVLFPIFLWMWNISVLKTDVRNRPEVWFVFNFHSQSLLSVFLIYFKGRRLSEAYQIKLQCYSLISFPYDFKLCIYEVWTLRFQVKCSNQLTANMVACGTDLPLRTWVKPFGRKFKPIHGFGYVQRNCWNWAGGI